MKINCLHPEAQLLYYNCHLRYIFKTPYKIIQFLSKFNFISSIMSIYVLHIMFGKDNYLTVSKLQTSCFYHNYFKNYKLLHMITPEKW